MVGKDDRGLLIGESQRKPAENKMAVTLAMHYVNELGVKHARALPNGTNHVAALLKGVKVEPKLLHSKTTAGDFRYQTRLHLASPSTEDQVAETRKFYCASSKPRVESAALLVSEVQGPNVTAIARHQF
jgi:hypothetical protein